jgi:Ca2+-binding EF-hand superfamily protein
MKDCTDHPYFSMDKRELALVSPAQFQGLIKFCEQQQVKRALLLEIASRLPMERAGQIVQIFSSLDANRDGNLSTAELARYFKQMGLDDPDLMRRTFEALDVDHDGMLSFSEFSAGALMLFKDILEERLHALFLKHDPTGDGALDLNEAKDFLDDALVAINTADDRQASAEALDKIMGQGSARGKVTYEELRNYILGPPASQASSRVSTARSSVRSGR